VASPSDFNHPAVAQTLVLLQNAMTDGVRLPAAIVDAVRNTNCPRCVEFQRRAPSGPQVSIPRVFAPGEQVHLDNAHCVIPQFVVDSGRWPISKVDVLVGTDACSNILSGDAFVGHTTGVKAV
jgi:hypothetical protein